MGAWSFQQIFGEEQELRNYWWMGQHKWKEKNMMMKEHLKQFEEEPNLEKDLYREWQMKQNEMERYAREK